MRKQSLRTVATEREFVAFEVIRQADAPQRLYQPIRL